MSLDEPRSAPRFHPDAPLPATFTFNGAAGSVGLRDLSVIGAQIEHSVPIRPATLGTLNLESISVRATVVWSRLAAPGIYRSGLQIRDELDVVAAKIRDLLRRGVVKPADGTAARRRDARRERLNTTARLIPPMPRPDGPSEEQMLLIREARQRLLMHSDDSVKWYNRARATATEEQMRIAESGRANREDVLAVWEYLGRSVDLRYVVQALS